MSRIAQFLCGERWAMRYDTLMALTEIVRRHDLDIRLSGEEIDKLIARGQGGGNRKYDVIGGVAVIPISGQISRYASVMGDLSVGRGTSVDSIRSMLNGAMSDESVSALLLSVNSPGGSSSGIADLADDLFRARSQKPIVTFVDGLAASGSYWLGSQANEIVGGSTAEVGSIGVYAVLYDESQAMADQGVKPIIVRTGDLKGIGIVGESVPDIHVAEIRKSINAIYDSFVASVARGRGLGSAKVLALANGGTETGQAAVNAGLMDGMASFDEALSRAAEAAKRKVSLGVKKMETQKAESAEFEKRISDAQQAARAECRTELAGLLSLFPGQESLVATEWATGSDSAGITAKASKAQQDRIADLERKSASRGQAVGTSPTDAPKVEKPNLDSLPTDDRIKAEWDGNIENCRSEFIDFGTYAAIRRVELQRGVAA